DAQALREEGGLAHALRKRLEVELDLLEDLEIGEERDRGTGTGVLRDGRALLQRSRRHAALVALRPDVAVAPDLEVEPLRERVHDRDADAVKPAGNLVAAPVAEVAAGGEYGQ